MFMVQQGLQCGKSDKRKIYAYGLSAFGGSIFLL